MSVRKPVQELIALGMLPNSEAEEDLIGKYASLLDQIDPPLSEAEAVSLCGIFRDDENTTYGLAWDVLHKVETCPSWPIDSCISGEGYWHKHLRLRVENGRKLTDTEG